MAGIKFSANFLAFSDSQDTNDPKDQTQIQITTEESSFSSLVRQKLAIADAVVDQSILVSAINSEYLLIYTDQIISIKLDGSSAARILKPKVAGTKTLVLMERGDITSILVSNRSGSIVNLDVISVKL